MPELDKLGGWYWRGSADRGGKYGGVDVSLNAFLDGRWGEGGKLGNFGRRNGGW
jgi:hypothetical protein